MNIEYKRAIVESHRTLTIQETDNTIFIPTKRTLETYVYGLLELAHDVGKDLQKGIIKGGGATYLVFLCDLLPSELPEDARSLIVETLSSLLGSH